MVLVLYINDTLENVIAGASVEGSLSTDKHYG